MKRFFEGAAITFSVGFLIFLIVLLVNVNKADAAEPVITPIDSCLDGWFWKAGTGEKETPPSLTPDGLYWNDNDTVNAVIAWHFSEVTPDAARIDTVDKWGMVDFAAAGPGSPGPNTAFKFLTSPWTGTWNYQGDGVWWKSAGGPVDINPAGTFTNDQMVEALGNYDAVVAAFGIGTETVSVDQPGFIIERVFFAGEAYSLKCAPEIIVSTVPGPVVTVIKTVTPSPSVPTDTRNCDQIGHRVFRGDADYRNDLDADGDGVGCESQPILTTVTPTLTRTAVVPVAPSAASGSSDESAFPWREVGIGGALVAAGGATLAALAVARRRSRQGEEPEAPEYDEAMREFDAALESLHPDSGAEGPGKHSVDNAPTQAIPYVDNGDAETERLPRQE